MHVTLSPLYNPPSLKELAKKASDPIIVQLSHAIGEYCLMNSGPDIYKEGLEGRLVELSRKFTPGLNLTKSLQNTAFAEQLANALAVQNQFIESCFEFDGMQSGYLGTADIPVNGKKQEFKQKDTISALKALHQLERLTQEKWEHLTDLQKELIAPAIFHRLFLQASKKAMDFCLINFDETMLASSKLFLKNNPYVIYKGKTHSTIEMIFSRFRADHELISGVMPNGRYYLLYTIFRLNQLENAKICWSAASEEQRPEIMKVLSCRLGDVRYPALVYAYLYGNEEMMDWLWSLATTLEIKKTLLQELISQANADDTFFNTALKIAMNDKQDFLALVENNKFELLIIAAKCGKYHVIEKYLKNKRGPINKTLYDQLFSIISESDSSLHSLLKEKSKYPRL